jgi:hypothetical protein
MDGGEFSTVVVFADGEDDDDVKHEGHEDTKTTEMNHGCTRMDTDF